MNSAKRKRLLRERIVRGEHIPTSALLRFDDKSGKFATLAEKAAAEKHKAGTNTPLHRVRGDIARVIAQHARIPLSRESVFFESSDSRDVRVHSRASSASHH